MTLKRIIVFTAIAIGLFSALQGRTVSDADTADHFSRIDELESLKNNPRFMRPFGIHGGFATSLIGDPLFLMVKINYFVIPQIELEINPGFKYSSAGLKYHLNPSDSKCILTPYTGALLGMERGTAILQIPFGIQLVSRKGFSASLNCSELIYLEYNRFELIFGIAAGWRIRMKNNLR